MDDVKSSWPLRVGLHTCYNGSYSGLIPKRCLSSDCRLQLDGMKSESLVIADQHVAVNTFPGLVHTARHTTKVGCSRSRWANPSGNLVTGAAWLSSARVVRCSVKSGNERNPYR